MTNLKERLSEHEPTEFRTLTFGELKEGERYITLPLPGDNHGHGGYRGAHYLFEKVKSGINSEDKKRPYNVRRINDSTLSNHPEDMEIIRIE